MNKETLKQYIIDNFEMTKNINKRSYSSILKNDLEYCIDFNDDISIYINKEFFEECMKELFNYKLIGNEYRFNCRNKENICHICQDKYLCGKVGIHKHQTNKRHKEYLKKKL